MTKHIAPYGSWPATINSQLLTQGLSRLSEPQLDGHNCFWLTSRPEEKGRTVVVCQPQTGEQYDLTPSDMSVRTRIHEYGGGSYRVHQGMVYFVNDIDQRIYSLPTAKAGELPSTAIPLTPEGDYRYSDFCIDEKRQQLICVCEIHKSGKRVEQQREPENCIVTIKLDGSSTTAFNVLVFGNDFYSNPRVSPDGQFLSWLTWKHPFMPWDNSECWLAEFSGLGLLQKHLKVAGASSDGSRSESVFQPQWSPTGDLYFVSDRTQWWNLYRYDPHTRTTSPILTMDAEFATPQWVFGMSTYGFINSFSLLCCYTQAGRWRLAVIDTLTGSFKTQPLPYSTIEAIDCNDETDTAVFIAAGDDSLDAVIHWHNAAIKEIATSGELAIDTEEFSKPEAIEFTNQQQQPVYGFYYAPHNKYCEAEAGALPPLIVICHGGPTGATRSALNLKIQYWTNRGFAVFDINYSGSTGFGRRYRDRLKSLWGLLDVTDICAGADYLVKTGRVDPQRLLVRGSSAGGFSVLAALTFSDHFKAGASLYGIGDLSLLARDTHKFESRYLDQLVGPYPQDKATYEARSPLHHVEQLQCPVIFLQGLEDKVVPPNQAETMVQALAEKNIPVAYVTFPDEGHGFRQADNIRYALDVEYAFYASLFDLNPAETLPTVPFVNSTREDN